MLLSRAFSSATGVSERGVSKIGACSSAAYGLDPILKSEASGSRLGVGVSPRPDSCPGSEELLLSMMGI